MLHVTLRARDVEQIVVAGLLAGGRGIGGRGIVREQILGDFAEPVGRNDVAREVDAGVGVADEGGASEREQGTEIAGDHSLGGHGGERGFGFGKPQTFVAVKEKQPVLFDGSTDGVTELIAFEGGQRTGSGEEIAGVHIGVAQEFIGRAVEAVGAGFRGHDDLAAGTETVLRRVDAGENIEFLNSVDGRAEVGDGDGGIVVVHAVQGEVVGELAGSGDAKGAAEALVVERCGGAGGERSKRVEGAAIERHLRNLGVVENGAHFGVVGVDALGIGRDGDVVGHVADFKSVVAAHVFGRCERDVFIAQSAEAGDGDFQVVDAARQERERIEAGLVGFGSPYGALFMAGEAYGGAWDHGSAGILNGSAQSGGVLRERQGCGKRERQENAKYAAREHGAPPVPSVIYHLAYGGKSQFL